jgi:hypothetical protein
MAHTKRPCRASCPRERLLSAARRCKAPGSHSIPFPPISSRRAPGMRTGQGTARRTGLWSWVPGPGIRAFSCMAYSNSVTTLRIKEVVNLLVVSGDTLRRRMAAGRIETPADASERLAVDRMVLTRFARESPCHGEGGAWWRIRCETGSAAWSAMSSRHRDGLGGDPGGARTGSRRCSAGSPRGARLGAGHARGCRR